MKRLFALMVGAVFLSPLAVSAQEWPSKPVRIIVPFAAGGAADTAARLYSEALAQAFGKQFVMENRPGGGGIPVAEAIARAEPDGYTLMVSGIPIIVVGPAMNKNVAYDPMRDLTHIAYFGGTPNMLAVHRSLGAKTYAEFLAYARKQPTAPTMCRRASAPWATGRRNIWRRWKTSSSITSPTRAARRRSST